MSDLKASVVETKNGFHVEGYEKIEYDFTFLDGVFNPANNNLAKCYERWGRCLAVMDLNIYNVYGRERGGSTSTANAPVPSSSPTPSYNKLYGKLALDQKTTP